MARLRERFADARDFEDGRGASAVVKSTGAGRDGIVMRSEKNGGAWLGAVETRGARGWLVLVRAGVLRGAGQEKRGQELFLFFQP